MPLIRLEGRDDPVPAEDGETLLAALKRHHVPVAFSCEAGNCGTCKMELVEGELFELDHSEYALPPELRAKNIVLACRSQVWDDVAVRSIDGAELLVHPSRVLGCRVLALDDLAHDVKRLRLVIETGGPFAFSAGQYARLEFGQGIVRSYSMANAPDDAVLEFHVRQAGGSGSRFVAEQLRAGDTVVVHGPLGHSYWRGEHAGPMLLVAGGTGLAPLRSILHAALASGRAGPIALYFGVRDERDVYLEDELARLAQRHANFRYQVVLSEPSAPTSRRIGLLADAVAHDIASLDGVKAYVAGPPAMAAAVSELLTARGLPLRDLHEDAFFTEAESAALSA